MEFHNEELGCKFALPDPLRLRHIEAFEIARDQARTAGARFAPSINWVGLSAVAEDWECKDLPDPAALTPEELADVHGSQLKIVMWASNAAAVYILKHIFVPKN